MTANNFTTILNHLFPWRRARLNRKFKDHLFRFLFREKSELLSLYNAVNGTDYTDPDALTIMTLEDVIYLGMKNDVSFLIDGRLSLYEHQSSICPNMPLRGLFEKGEQEDAALECRAVVLNINEGYNGEIMEKCRTLADYSAFIQQIRNYQKAGFAAPQAVALAIDYCIERDMMLGTKDARRIVSCFASPLRSGRCWTSATGAQHPTILPRIRKSWGSPLRFGRC